MEGDNPMRKIYIQPYLDIHADDPSLKLKLKIFGGPAAGAIYYYKQG